MSEDVSESDIKSAICTEQQIIQGSDVKRMRRALGITQEEFAKRFGVAPATIAAWECGNRPISGMAHKFLSTTKNKLMPIIKLQDDFMKEN